MRIAGEKSTGIRLERTILWLVCVGLAVHAFHLALVAWRLPVDYWDGYEYLRNARILAGHQVTPTSCGYVDYRPPLLPLLLGPAVRGYAPAGGGSALRGPHLMALALSILSVFALYWLLRQAFSPVETVIGGTLLAANPLFIHYAPFVMTDLPTMLFVTVAAVAYLQARQRGGWPLPALAASSLAAGALTKYTAVAMLGGLAAFELLRVLFPRADAPALGIGRRARRLLGDVQPWLIVAAACVIFYLVQAAADARAGLGSNALLHVVDIFRASIGPGPHYATDTTFELVPELTTAFSLPLMVVAVVGVLLAARRRTEVDLLCLAWFGVLFAAFTFLVGHKEARYAFPVLPPLIYFMVGGLRALRSGLVSALGWLAGERSGSRRTPELVAAALLLCLALKPAALAGGELRHFHDPVYTKPFLPEVARWALAHGAPGRRVLVRRYFVYSMYPANPFFMTDDEFYHFHHISGCALAYLLDRPVEETAETEPIPWSPPGSQQWARLVARFATSEVVVTGGMMIDTGSGEWPEPPEPLTLTFVGRRTLGRVEGGTPDDAIYRAADEPEHGLVLARKGDGWKVAEGDPGPDWQVYQRGAPGGPAEPLAQALASEPPAVVELVTVEQVQRAFR